jgi:nucleotide-binding universal stress UspA family protein
MPGIIAGVDGSAQSRNALDWALNEAALRDEPLTVLAVSPLVAGMYGPGYAPADFFPAEEEARLQTEKAVGQLVAEAVDRRGRAAPAVTVRTVIGLAADELINASEDASLLVIGARGAGGFARLIMGSVSTPVTQHARCPVAVIPGPADEPGADRAAAPGGRARS